MNAEISKFVSSFWEDWSKHHKDRQPMGLVLRQDTELPWVRFHALPESKRYADTAEEMATILARGNCLASELLGHDSVCWVICATLGDAGAQGELVGTWPEDQNEPDDMVWRFFVSQARWSEGAYDKELQEIADDAPYYLVWFDAESGKVFAPYDGGFDLFPCSDREVEDLKRRHADWLSDDEGGL